MKSKIIIISFLLAILCDSYGEIEKIQANNLGKGTHYRHPQGKDGFKESQIRSRLQKSGSSYYFIRSGENKAIIQKRLQETNLETLFSFNAGDQYSPKLDIRMSYLVDIKESNEVIAALIFMGGKYVYCRSVRKLPLPPKGHHYPPEAGNNPKQKWIPEFYSVLQLPYTLESIKSIKFKDVNNIEIAVGLEKKLNVHTYSFSGTNVFKDGEAENSFVYYRQTGTEDEALSNLENLSDSDLIEGLIASKYIDSDGKISTVFKNYLDRFEEKGRVAKLLDRINNFR